MVRQPLHTESKVGTAIDKQAIVRLAREASIELNVQDLPHLDASRAFLPAGQRVYISHLPKQDWEQTLAACSAVNAAGFDAIPHVPVRLLDSEATLDRFLERAVRQGSIKEVLLIAGDYPKAVGPYATVADVLRHDRLSQHGLHRVSLAGHPEGHPIVPLQEIRRTEAEKSRLAIASGLETTLLTQFFFEAEPFVDWVNTSRAAGIRARLIGGLSGPARITTLFKFAMRCGVGPSIRALGARPGSVTKLIREHGPEPVMSDLANARQNGLAEFDGVHLFCFGGYLRTCEWLKKVADGDFEPDPNTGFKVVS